MTNIFDDIKIEQQDTPMKTGKATGWGVFNYHWVQLPNNQEKPLEIFQDALTWCKENLGRSGTRWFEKSNKFYFKDERDMTMFILKFCS